MAYFLHNKELVHLGLKLTYHLNGKGQFKAEKSFADFSYTLLNKENGIHNGKLVANFEETIKTVDSIKFSVFSPSEIRKYSVAEITAPETYESFHVPMCYDPLFASAIKADWKSGIGSDKDLKLESIQTVYRDGIDASNSGDRH